PPPNSSIITKASLRRSGHARSSVSLRKRRTPPRRGRRATAGSDARLRRGSLRCVRSGRLAHGCVRVTKGRRSNARLVAPSAGRHLAHVLTGGSRPAWIDPAKPGRWGKYLCRREGIERKDAGNDLTLEEGTRTRGAGRSGGDAVP